MNIHEFQAKEILKRFGVAVPRGIVATTPEQAKAAAQELGGGVSVGKAQIHAGGRGKGGGVHVAKSPDEAAAKAREMLGKNLVTHQTGPEGRQVRRVLVEQGLNIERELYLAMVLDRAQSRVTVICSSEGGADKEKVAQAFKILLADARVRGVLINIFGGIMRCDVLAQGVVDAARELNISVPLVVRMQGTNVEQGRKILAESGLTIISAETMAEAAEKIVKAVQTN